MNENNETNDRPTGPQPPFPVTELNGFFYFVRARGFSAAYHGQYARDFAAWADLPAVEETPSEPSGVEFGALLRARERKYEQQRQAKKRRGGSAGRSDGKNFEYAG